MKFDKEKSLDRIIDLFSKNKNPTVSELAKITINAQNELERIYELGLQEGFNTALRAEKEPLLQSKSEN